MTKISLKCKCGAVEGSVSQVSPRVGNHVVCYCNDCQAFANHLSTGDNTLDEWGGTEIYQTATWHIEIHKGSEQLKCLRLTPKGLYRWYTGCCNTPVGNTISANFPFIGLIHRFMNKDEHTESNLGPVRGYHQLDSAIGTVPDSIQNKGMPVGCTMAVIWRLLKWKLTAGNKPNLFFNDSGQSVSRPDIVSTKHE